MPALWHEEFEFAIKSSQFLHSDQEVWEQICPITETPMGLSSSVHRIHEGQIRKKRRGRIGGVEGASENMLRIDLEIILSENLKQRKELGKQQQPRF